MTDIERNKLISRDVTLLRDAGPENIARLRKTLVDKRTAWYGRYGHRYAREDDGLLLSAYQMLLDKLEILPEDVPIIEKNADRIVFHSMNFCPILEACKILDYDTRNICRQLNEGPTDQFVKLLDPRLTFRRNYKNLRPYCNYCEEMIVLEE
jgi:tRNA(adenine34) deaminase